MLFQCCFSIPDEWIKRPQDSFKSTFQLVKNVSVKQMSSSQRNALQDHISIITKAAPRSSSMHVKQSRKFSSTCSSSRTSIDSTST